MPKLTDELSVEHWPVGRLRGYPANPRKNDHVVDRMVEAIKAYGFRIPIVAKSDGLIVDGHLRLKAAMKLGIKTVPVALADDLTEDQIRAFRLLANQSASWAEWDMPLLKLELEALRLSDYPLELTGFDDIQLVQFMANVSTNDPEATPEPPATPVTRKGDIWVLGKHRLMCGDATSESDVAACLDGAQPHLMVTDPPFGVDYDPMWREEAARKGLIGFSPSALGSVTNDTRIDWKEAWEFFPGDVAYVWHADRHASQVQRTIEASGFEIRCQIIWAKSSFAISRGHYNWQHEPCWYAVREGKTGHWFGDKSASTLWQIAHAKNETGHSTQKPIECMKRPIENNSQPGDAVYDPFLGSGTTLIAAEMTARHCLGLEISEQYCDVICQRWMDFAGGEAILESTGQTYAEVKAEREAKPKRRKRVAANA